MTSLFLITGSSDYLKEIYPSQLTTEKANKSPQLGFMTNMMILTSTLSIFNSFQ